MTATVAAKPRSYGNLKEAEDDDYYEELIIEDDDDDDYIEEVIDDDASSGAITPSKIDGMSFQNAKNYLKSFHVPADIGGKSKPPRPPSAPVAKYDSDDDYEEYVLPDEITPIRLSQRLSLFAPPDLDNISEEEGSVRSQRSASSKSKASFTRTSSKGLTSGSPIVKREERKLSNLKDIQEEDDAPNSAKGLMISPVQDDDPSEHATGAVVDSTLRLRLVESTIRSGSRQFDVFLLECPILTRIWPLIYQPLLPSKQPRRRQRRPSTKRLESFWLAKSMDIQPDQCVWDPICGRATILIEAAKYWSWAKSFYGSERDLATLEHARMNAESTHTLPRLHLHHGKEIPAVAEGTIDKLVTCLPSGTTKLYTRWISTWFDKAMAPGGELYLLVAMDSLEDLELAVATCGGCWIRFVRSPSLRWGMTQSTLVIVVSGRKEGGGENSKGDTSRGLMEWELNSFPPLGSWERKELAELRSRTLPVLAPILAGVDTHKRTTTRECLGNAKM